MVGQGLAADAMNLITDFLRNDTKVGHDLGVILDKLTPGGKMTIDCFSTKHIITPK